MQQLISSHYYYYRFRYTTTFREAFLQNGIAALQNLDSQGWVAGSDANVFVSNHDTERVRQFPLLTITGFNLSWCRTITPSMRTRLQIPIRWLASSPCMFLHCPSSVQDMFLTTDFFYLPCPFSRSAHPYGTPSILSSYSNFYNTDAGGPNGGTACIFHFPTPTPLRKFSGGALIGTGTCWDTVDVARW